MAASVDNKDHSLKLVQADKSCREGTGGLGCTLPADPKLVAEGWELRFVADARMARDAVDTYSELGYEVRLEPVDTDDLKEECGGCKALFQQFKALYTRKAKTSRTFSK